MKLACALLVLLPLAFAAPHERMLLDTLFQGEELKTLVSGLVHTLESDETERMCEAECHQLIKADHLLQFGCPLVCQSLQSLAHRFGVHPAGTMPPSMASA